MLVYKVTNQINNKLYIGICSTTVQKRKNEHIHNAFTKHINYVFYKALRKYGKDNFLWEEIDKCDTADKLRELEKYYIQKHNTYYLNGNGYNMTLGGDGIFGYKFTKKQREKMRLSHVGYVMPTQQKQKISNSNKGKSNTIEHNEKISKAFSKKWKLTYSDGHVEIITNLKKFCEKNQYSYKGKYIKVLGIPTKYKKIKCEKIL